ncbi:N-acetylglucosamine-6-phosphate deacetylase [Lactobacillus terrae]|uniref:N-acetylglucosamine-6-phosphate deacetylase n=1 Tax=Lactobacillus terrae TaxID=2269374 RepID=UPI000C1B652E|nr:N-acetylglucosamine-6-phosphate deacetylase [Lactobacillus terrae]
MTYYIHAKKFFLPNKTEVGGYLEVTDSGKFGQYFTENNKPNGEIVDYSNQMIAPGLVDTHIHGLVGNDVMDNDWNMINEMSEGLLQAGVTSWLPTTLTATREQLNDVCRTIGDNYQSATGAKIQGIYFEGPFFTEEHKGAQNPKYFTDPDVDAFNEWQESANGMIKKIAIAPERKGSAEFTKAVASDDVVVSLGHSSATFDQAKEVIEAGATMFTHAFNGMSGFSHRDPNMAGAAMTLNGIYDELVCDGHHVHPDAARAIIELKDSEHIALITDCMRAGLMPDGDYVLGELPVYVADGQVRLKDGDNLAGSVLQLKQAIKNVVDWNISTPEEAVRMGAQTPAVSCQIDDKCGMIKEGRDADFIVLDEDMILKETYLDGVSHYKA